MIFFYLFFVYNESAHDSIIDFWNINNKLKVFAPFFSLFTFFSVNLMNLQIHEFDFIVLEFW